MHKAKVYYKLCLTNADLEEVAVVREGTHLDILETVLWDLFKGWDYEKDFYVLNMNTMDFVTVVFSPRSQRLRGECAS